MKKFVFLFFLISLNTFSQKTKPIYGTVIDSISPVLDANIINKNSKIGTNSNTKGEFKIYAQIGDTIVFSSIQHQTKEFIVSDRSFVSFNFKINLKLKNGENEINAVTLGLPNAGIPKLKPIDRKIYTASTSNGLVSLDLILNTLNGTIKNLKNQKKIIEDNEDVEELYGEYKFNLGTDFKIGKEDEYRFLYFCRSDSTFKIERSKNKFEFINFMKKKAIQFNKIKNE